MNRQDFLKSFVLVTVGGQLVPMPIFGRDSTITQHSSSDWTSDRILVLIKLDGGNDGLNTIVPTEDPLYYQARSDIAITKANARPLNESLGLHPMLSLIEPLLGDDQMSIVQGVGYPNGDMSHFRSTDIWTTGSASTDIWKSGWLGRLLSAIQPQSLATGDPTPSAIQFGSANLLEFQSTDMNHGLMMFDPNEFYRLVADNFVEFEGGPTADTFAGDELDFIRSLDRTTFDYSLRTREAYNLGTNEISYPETDLGNQLKLVAQMISGGLQTPIYRLHQPGYDTHIDQADSHGDLLWELSDAVSKFIYDLRSQGLMDRVMVMTTSEFGRTIKQNGGQGTDHATSGPMLIFGEHLKHRVVGSNPDLADLDLNQWGQGELKVQHDFRQIYANVITDWFGLPASVADDVFQQPTINLDLFAPSTLAQGGRQPNLPTEMSLLPAYPNPFNPATTIRFALPRTANVRLNIYDLGGRKVRALAHGRFTGGSHQVRWDGRDSAGRVVGSGHYIARLTAGRASESIKLSLIR